MSHELICFCLQLSPAGWPPDHYTLLGLEPGESDSQRIEQHVLERMEKLRGYQLTHADQVTEGMNRLAQALVCLTDPAAKKAYDAKLPARQAKRSTRAKPFRRSNLTDPARPRALPRRARVLPRWLLMAWILWLAVGLAGLVAVVHYLPAIQESYLGVTDGVTEATKPRPGNPIPRSEERRLN